MSPYIAASRDLDNNVWCTGQERPDVAHETALNTPFSEARTHENAGDAEAMSSPENEPHAAFQTSAECGRMLCIPVQYCRGKSGLSRVELALLAYIMEHPVEQAPRSVIADECGCAANSIPRAAKKLEAIGLIKRAKGGGTRNTTYELTRNLHVARNMEVTTADTSTLRAANSDAQTETTTRDMVVTQVTGGRNIAPPDPPIRTTSTSETLPETEEDVSTGGVGEFALESDEPKRKQRRKATERSMPKKPTPAMLKHAAEKGFVNGTAQQMFDEWRDWHIARATEIACHEASWRTWVGKRVKWRGEAAAKKSGYIKRTRSDGSVYYDRDHRQNHYRA